jgi:hypothetical protein
MEELMRRLDSEQQAGPSHGEVCNGTFLSRKEYISDIQMNRFEDARLGERCAMTVEEVREWTAAGAEGN